MKRSKSMEKLKLIRFSENDINNVLNNLYSTNFFEDVKINLNNNKLIISLKEYPVINQLILVGEKER